MVSEAASLPEAAACESYDPAMATPKISKPYKLSVEAPTFVPGKLPPIRSDIARTYSKLDRVPFSPACGVVTPSPYSKHMAVYHWMQQCADGQWIQCWSPVSPGDCFMHSGGSSGSPISPPSVLGPMTPQQGSSDFRTQGSSPSDEQAVSNGGSSGSSGGGTPHSHPGSPCAWHPGAPHGFHPSAAHNYQPGTPHAFHPGVHNSPFVWPHAVSPMAMPPLTPGTPLLPSGFSPMSPGGYMPPSPGAFPSPHCGPLSPVAGQRHEPGLRFNSWQQVQLTTPQMPRRPGLSRMGSGLQDGPPTPGRYPSCQFPTGPAHPRPLPQQQHQGRRVPLAEVPAEAATTAAAENEEAAPQLLSPVSKASGMAPPDVEQLAALMAKRQLLGNAVPKEMDELAALLEADSSANGLNARQRRTMRRAIERCVKAVAAAEAAAAASDDDSCTSAADTSLPAASSDGSTQDSPGQQATEVENQVPCLEPAAAVGTVSSPREAVGSAAAE